LSPYSSQRSGVDILRMTHSLALNCIEIRGGVVDHCFVS
jgi:hypothetical protein